MSSTYRVEYLNADDFEAWNAFVDTSPQGSVYSTSTFLHALCHAAQTRFKILAVKKGDDVHAGVALHYEPSRFGDVVSRRGLLYYNGIVFRDFDTKYPSQLTHRHVRLVRILLEELEDESKYASVQLSMRHTQVDTRPFTWSGWEVYPQYTYVVPIADLQAQWCRAEQNIRRLISRCEKEGMQIIVDDDFDEFYRLHSLTYERIGKEAYFPCEIFRELYTTLKQSGTAQIYTALMPDGTRGSSQIVLSTAHPVTHIWAAGSDPACATSGVSAFLRWKVFEILHERGYAYHDLTDAMEESVAKFKAQFGGDLVSCPIVSRMNSRAMRRYYRVQSRLVAPISRMVERIFSQPLKPKTASKE